MSNNKKSSTKINVTNKFAVLDLHSLKGKIRILQLYNNDVNDINIGDDSDFFDVDDDHDDRNNVFDDDNYFVFDDDDDNESDDNDDTFVNYLLFSYCDIIFSL